MPRDSSGRNKGHAVIEFHRHRDAKNAVKEMDGFKISGRQLKCSIVTEQMARLVPSAKDYDLEDDSANQFIHSAQSRVILMQKLSREPNTIGGSD